MFPSQYYPLNCLHPGMSKAVALSVKTKEILLTFVYSWILLVIKPIQTCYYLILLIMTYIAVLFQVLYIALAMVPFSVRLVYLGVVCALLY